MPVCCIRQTHDGLESKVHLQIPTPDTSAGNGKGKEQGTGGVGKGACYRCGEADGVEKAVEETAAVRRQDLNMLEINILRFILKKKKKDLYACIYL